MIKISQQYRFYMIKFRLYSSTEICHIFLIFHNLDVEFFCLVEFIYVRY